MFRDWSSWLGLKQPEGAAAKEEQPGADQPLAGDAPPEEHSKSPAEPTEVEQQPTEDPALLHQAKGLGSEFPPGRKGGPGGDEGLQVCERGPSSAAWDDGWVRSWATPKLQQVVLSCPRRA